MSADLYRDAYLGIRARLAELGVRIREREAEVTDAFWASLEADVRARLAERRESVDLVASDKDLSFEELARSEAALASYLDELERLIARLPIVEEEWRRLPDDVPDPPPPRDLWFDLGIPAENEHAELARAFERMVRERDRDAVFETTDRSLLARFHSNGAPFALRATAQTKNGGHIEEVLMWLVTSVARAMPPLVVRHETLALAFGKALGVKHEVEVGEPSFDGLFLIEGERGAALRLLTTNVRGLLLVLSHYDVPTFEIDPPNRVASLKWRFEPTAKALDAAVRVLASVRDTTADVQFRR